MVSSCSSVAMIWNSGPFFWIVSINWSPGLLWPGQGNDALRAEAVLWWRVSRGALSQLVKPAKWACKTGDQNIGFVQERPCDYTAFLRHHQAHFAFVAITAFVMQVFLPRINFIIKLTVTPWLSSVETNLIRSLSQILLTSGASFLVLPFQIGWVLQT